MNPHTTAFFSDDFVGGSLMDAAPSFTPNIPYIYTYGSMNSSLPTFNIADVSGHPGSYSLNTGSGTTNFSTLHLRTLEILASGVVTVEAVFKLSALSLITLEYRTKVGLIPNLSSVYSGAPDFTDTDSTGVYFMYDRLVRGSNWWTVTSTANGFEEYQDTGIPVSAAWVKLKLVCDSVGSSVKFYANDAQVTEHTTRIPTTGFVACTTKKSAGLGGVSVNLDYWSRQIDFYTGR